MEPVFSRDAAPVVSVSELLRRAREALETRFPLQWVCGEISSPKRAPSGHLYFTLKDERAQAECVLYRSRAALLDWEPREGMKVEVRALVTLYEPRGRFQLAVEAMRRAGPGPLYERFLRLRDRLEKEGLFDPAARRPIPACPRAIGVVTSLAAAALRDVLSTLARRNPAIPVIVYPAPVQGEGAAARIAAALAAASRRAECDVLLLVRGGGSIEDLWPFNEEVVARAIRASRLPVVVGVGHESDVTIADLAADRRAPTPTAAAELVSPPRAALASAIARLAARASREVRRRLNDAAQALDGAARRLVHPAERLRGSRRLLAQLAARLVAGTGRRIEAGRHRLDAQPPRLAAAASRALADAAARLGVLQARLAALDPAAVLGRGYSITRTADGRVLRDWARAREGERLVTTLAHGWVESEVRRRGGSARL